MTKGRGRGRGRGIPAVETEQRVLAPLAEITTPSSGGRGRGRGRATPVASPEHLRAEATVAAAPASSISKPQPCGPIVNGVHKKVESSFTQFAPRPGYGTLGQKIGLIVNYFPIELPHGKVYHYDVDIEQMSKFATNTAKPRRINPRVCRELFKIMVSENAAFRNHLPVYDGNKNLYTRTPLAIYKAEKFNVTLKEGPKLTNYVVTVKPSKMKERIDPEVDLEPLHSLIQTGKGTFPVEAFQAVDIILRHGPSLKMVPIGRSFFAPPKWQDIPPFGGGRELWIGHFQSIKPTAWRPVLNIDLTATTFYKRGPFIDFARELLECKLEDFHDLKLFQYKKLKSYCDGMKVKVLHQPNGRVYRVTGLSKVGANALFFDMPEGPPGSKTTVESYFAARYRPLRYPTFPCLTVPGRNGSAHMPFEVCEIVEGQSCRKKMEGDLTAKMIKQTLRTPVERFEEIRCKLNDMIAQSRPYLDEFGIKIDTRAANVEARVLEPPTVVYNGSKCTPARGAWNMIENKFFRGATISNWQMINYGNCRRDQLKKFADMLCDVGKGIGLNMSPARDIRDLSRETRLGVAEILRRLKEKEKDLELVVIVVPSNSLKSNYAEVKQVGDTKIGLITQCVQDKTVSFKCNSQVVSNICQKINTKMGGINNSIYINGEKPRILETPVIIFGADVTHPAPGDKVSPSVAAVVANLDGIPSRFATRVRVQKDRSEIQARVEMILELKDMVKELLLQFYHHLSKKPEKIIFYRDGVSEGQFLEVLDFEVSQIRKACTELNADYKPPLTFIIVQKRHHTRFCPQDKRDGCGRPGNIPPGTTVDRKITHPKDYDFYLCSHYGQQGTSRPTHYTVLWDENNLSADEMQMLSYHLCHTYARCTRSISNPVPAQYAHLAAYRARDHLKVIFDDASTSSSGSDDSVKQDVIEKAVEIVKSLQDKMYFI